MTASSIEPVNLGTNNLKRRQQQTEKKGTVVLPCVQGVAERIKRSLVTHNVRTAFRPHQTLASVF